MEVNKGVGKRESKKLKKPRSWTSEFHPGESRALCPFHGLTARNESAAEGQEGATDLPSVFDQLLWLAINCSTGLLRMDPLALQGKAVGTLQCLLLSSYWEPADGLISCGHKIGITLCHQHASLWYKKLLWCHILQQRCSLLYPPLVAACFQWLNKKTTKETKTANPN